jgi:protein-disulfide isomerase
MIETYAESGQVRFEYKHFPFIGPESTQAALAAECANEQGKFWEYHDLLFANQKGENQGAFRNNVLKQLAVEAGLDVDQFSSCLSSAKYRRVIEQDRAEARQLGVQSTPIIFVNDQRFDGAYPFEDFQKAIEAELAKAQ